MSGGTVEARIAEVHDALALIDTKLSMYREWLTAGGSPIEVPETPGEAAET